MLSIFIMYSTDRREALEATISCLEDMPLYRESQKTLVVDGKTDLVLPDWEVVQVPRVGDKFCWGRMWDAGVCTARYEKVVYLDSDRLLTPDYLSQVANLVKDDHFLYTSHHFQMLKKLPVNTCKEFLYAMGEQGVFMNDEFMGSVKFEARHGEPIHGPGKNVMSGSTAFTKNTYFRLGGVDHWYCGHGAFADTDFHYTAAVGGCQFIDLKIPELHWPHDKKENKKALEDQELWLLGLDNFLYYAAKWELPLVLAENLALRCGIKKTSSYVKKRLKDLHLQ